MRDKLLDISRTELAGINPAWSFLRVPLGLLPTGAFMRLRGLLLRMYGLPVGRGCIFSGTPTFIGSKDPRKQLRFGERCFINWPAYFDVSDKISLGANVAVGHHAVFVTASHKIGGPDARAACIETKPIRVEDGAWIGASVTILPGVTVGAGSVVAAGSVVVKDVSPNTLVGGVPARFIRDLDAVDE